MFQAHGNTDILTDISNYRKAALFSMSVNCLLLATKEH